MTPLRIIVDRDLCAACDVCTAIAPETFVLDDTAKAFVRDPSGNPRKTVVEAAANCPMEAITVHDEDSGKQLVPKPSS